VNGVAFDLLTVGESMGLVVADEVGPFATASTARISFGGSESNVAIAAARMGCRVAWASRLGSDSIGDKIVRELRAEGVHAVVERDPILSTGMMLKERRTPMHSRVTYYRKHSAAAAIEPRHVPDELIQQSRLLHVTGITPAISSTARATTLSVVARARRAGLRVSLDVNYRSALWGRDAAAEALLELVPYTDILFGGVEELQMLGADADVAGDPHAARRRFGVAELVVKDGANGASVSAEDGTYSLPAIPVAVVDTVGAGDAFVAGYLTALLEGLSTPDRLGRAVRAGALACTSRGDWEGAPTLHDLALLDSIDPVQR
jgi:2-dehydro-3-deoxygluconokinase